MRFRRGRLLGAAFAIVLAAVAVVAVTQLPAIGAGALLHPMRRPMRAAPPPGCVDEVIQGHGVQLKAWRCRAAGTRRGSLVYLHGIADNRASAAGVIARFVPRGFDVVAYDGRAHGESEGEACTYGFYEKDDLARVIDTLERGPVALIGTSLGGAVALQHAARDPRVSVVVAAETFSDLRRIVDDRVPFVFSRAAIEQAFRLAEQRTGFRVDDVSPARAAEGITAPVLLIHGAADADTPAAHSERVLAALKGPKRLLLVPDATHNRSLREEIWPEIEAWIEAAVAAHAGHAGNAEERAVARQDRVPAA